MRITESKVRQIIKEEAIRVLREQATPAGAAISNLTGADPAAAEATAKAAAKLLEPNPIFKSIFPGGYAELLPAIKSALLSLGSLFVPRPFMFVMQDMLQSGAIASIVSRERKAGKIPLEIMLSVAQAVAARSKSVNESRRRRRLREEVGSLQEMRAPGYLNPRRTFQDIKDLVDEALMNKSFGMPGRVTDSYVSDLNKLIDHMNNGGQSNVGDGEEWDEDKHGFGSAGPRGMSESINDSFDDFGGGTDEGDPFEDDRMTPESVIDRYKDEGPRSWMRVSNDFREMADGGMDDILEKYYPGLTADDCAMIADELDRHFGMS